MHVGDCDAMHGAAADHYQELSCAGWGRRCRSTVHGQLDRSDNFFKWPRWDNGALDGHEMCRLEMVDCILEQAAAWKWENL